MGRTPGPGLGQQGAELPDTRAVQGGPLQAVRHPGLPDHRVPVQGVSLHSEVGTLQEILFSSRNLLNKEE